MVLPQSLEASTQKERSFKPINSPSVKVPSNTHFVARESFKPSPKGAWGDGWYGIHYLASNFEANFLDLIEDGVEARLLKKYKVKSCDHIVVLPHGKNRTIISLANAFDFIKKCDGYKYLFFLADAKGVVWAVTACKGYYGYCMEAHRRDCRGRDLVEPDNQDVQTFLHQCRF